MKTYTITNDAYSNQPDVVTFDELVTICKELGWESKLTERNGKVYDQKGEIVAE